MHIKLIISVLMSIILLKAVFSSNFKCLFKIVDLYRLYLLYTLFSSAYFQKNKNYYYSSLLYSIMCFGVGTLLFCEYPTVNKLDWEY